MGHIRIDLHLQRAVGSLIASNRCQIEFNPQKLLRRDLGFAPGESERCFDGNDNTLPDEYQGAAALERQLETATELLEKIVLVFLSVLLRPYLFEIDRLWLKAAEAFYDTAVPDAIETARILQTSALRGATEMHRRAYERGASDAAGIPLISYRETAHGPRLKQYPKRAGRLRSEVSCPTRREIVEQTRAVDAPGTGEGLRGLILGFAAAAVPLVDRLREHAADALQGCASPVDLITGLHPLVRLAAGQARAQGETVEKARHALGQLLSCGFCDVSGDNPRHAHVMVLRQIVAEGVAMTQHPSRLKFYLRPEFGRATRDLAQAGQPSWH